MTPIRLLVLPYHLGRRDHGMGRGPDRLIAAGAAAVLPAADVHTIDVPVSVEAEADGYFAVLPAVADAVDRTLGEGRLPVVLAGDCGTVLGAVAGINRHEPGTGVVWFDAHADAHTPHTSETGYIDGMPVAMLTGYCWTDMTATVPGFGPVPGDRLVLSGVRAPDRAERALLHDAQVTTITADRLADSTLFTDALAALARSVPSVHVHVDLDVIDTSDGIANSYALGGGPALATLERCFDQIGRHCRTNSVSLTSYDPHCDSDGRARAAALRLLPALGRLAR
ncbi:arginase family protein [Nocardia transvalensis]|uniref:arginase family protein n=1 Tax=Nocardia transvalensis TaxID=37333 RepID=UPI001895AF28|nr:arginase family protein [Nocardia transvalensis]MBF6331440.1 arginase family protein [Nocardia transvalensis]